MSAQAPPAIPARFGSAIDQHLVFNFAEISEWPLVLGVFGRPGDGKSFQMRTHLVRRGVKTVSVNAADLESDRAGLPGKLVLDMYTDAGHRIEEGTPAAVVVDDFDTTVGEWEHSTTTVNHQQVLAQLMHLADNPTEAAGRRLSRVPVFITGNDLSKVYPPLRRPGRMRAFPWLPSEAERAEVVGTILGPLLDASDVSDLLGRLPEAPIAFFSDLVVEVLAEVAKDEVQKQASALGQLIRPKSAGRAALVTARERKMHTSDISEMALQMWSDRALATQSHLGS